MGREIKRVDLNFEWPVDTIWKGYINPYRPINCKSCDGTGDNPATKQLGDDWYDFDRTGRKWCDDITQDEVDALIAASRLIDFTHTWTKDDGWKRREDQYVPTAKEVNDWQRSRGMGHDAINRWICVETRAKRLGVYGKCSLCNGDGHYWCESKYEELYQGWERIEPPDGEGFQLWETVSEGSPISPVFKTPEDLATWCAAQTDKWFSRNSSYDQWLKFIGVGWAPSLIVQGGEAKDGVDAC